MTTHAPAPAPITATIDGIPGEHALTGFAVAARNTPVSAGGGGGAGKVQFDAVRLTKAYDAASPTLLLRTASGQHLPAATVVLRKAGATTTYKLSDVVLTGYRQENLTEEVELGFSQVRVTHQPATGAPVSAGWDVKLNRSL